MYKNNFGNVLFVAALMTYSSCAIDDRIISKWLNLARSVESVIRSNNATKDDSNIVKISKDIKLNSSTTTPKLQNATTNSTSAPFVFNAEENINIVRDTLSKLKQQLGLEDTNSDYNEVLGMLMNEPDSKIAANVTRTIVSDAATETIIDGIADSIVPILASVTPMLSSITKSILPQISSQMLNDISNITMELFSSGKITKAIKEPEYEAYPLFIPNYGSYIMLTNAGAFDPVELIKKTVNKGEGPSHSKTTSSATKSTLNDIVDTTEIYETMDVTEDEFKDAANNSAKREHHKVSERKLNPDIQTFFLGQIQLIPLHSHPDVFSKTKSLWNFTEEEAVKEGIQKVIAARTSAKEIRKRLILYWLRQLENVIVKT